MVYESDFYTTRRPYRTTPSLSTYTYSVSIFENLILFFCKNFEASNTILRTCACKNLKAMKCIEIVCIEYAIRNSVLILVTQYGFAVFAKFHLKALRGLIVYPVRVISGQTRSQCLILRASRIYNFTYASRSRSKFSDRRNACIIVCFGFLKTMSRLPLFLPRKPLL